MSFYTRDIHQYDMERVDRANYYLQHYGILYKTYMKYLGEYIDDAKHMSWGEFYMTLYYLYRTELYSLLILIDERELYDELIDEFADDDTYDIFDDSMAGVGEIRDEVEEYLNYLDYLEGKVIVPPMDIFNDYFMGRI